MRDNIRGGITNGGAFKPRADVTLLSRSLHPWMKLPGSMNVELRLHTVIGTGGHSTPLRDARTASVRCGARIDVFKILRTQNFASSGM